MATKFTISSIFQAVDKITGPTKKMQKSVTGFSKASQRGFQGMSTGLRTMRRLITGVAAVLATGAIAKGITKFAEQGDMISKTSRQIGMTAEALQELQFAAERQGISTEDFTKSMQKMNKNVGEARAGTGALTTLLNKTNPALLEQLKLVENSEEAFNLLVEEIEGQANQMDKAAIANAAFGRSGKNMLILAEGGTEAIADLREEARKYGGVISDEAAKGSEVFVDSLTNLKSAMQGLRNNALAPLISKIQPLLQQFADFIARNKDLIALRAQQIFNAITFAVEKLVKFATPLVRTIIKIAKELTSMFTETEIGTKIIDLLGSAFKAIVPAVKLMWKVVKPILKLFLTVLEPILDIVNGIVKGIGAVADFLGKGNEGPSMADYEAASRGRAGLIGRNDGLIESRSTTTNRSTVDVNFNNPPAGTAIKQKGKAPDVNLNLGVPSGLAGASW